MRAIFLWIFVLWPLAGQSSTFFGFEPNLGQYPSGVHFVRRAIGSTERLTYLTRDTFVTQRAIRLQIAGVDSSVIPQGESPSNTRYNYYLGNTPSSWRTNVRSFDAVRLANIYPGVSAVFSYTVEQIGLSQQRYGAIVLTLQPGADLARFRLQVHTGGANVGEGPGGIWFTGGSIPGVFIIRAAAAQINGDTRSHLPCNLKIESQDILSLQASAMNPALAAEFVITFPDAETGSGPGGPIMASDGNSYIRYAAPTPRSFGQDGSIPGPACESPCSDAIVGRLDTDGQPMWINIIGGDRHEESGDLVAVAGGVALAGTTASGNFPVTQDAPHRTPGSPRDVFLAFFDRNTGELRGATYGGIDGYASPTAMEISGEDVAVGAAVSMNDPIFGSAIGRGKLLRWNPAGNRFVFNRSLDHPVTAVAFDTQSNLYFAGASFPDVVLTAGIVDPGGIEIGKPVTATSLTGAGTSPFYLQYLRILPATLGQAWFVYSARSVESSTGNELGVARISFLQDQTIANRHLARNGFLMSAGLTPAGNLKLLARDVSWTEETTPNAPLVAACPGSNYFAILSTSAQLIYTTYVPSEGFDFENAREPQTDPPAKVSCFANTAGRWPSPVAAPGQLITITGGGFGPTTPIFTAPDQNGVYPKIAGQFRVRIAGIDAPIIGVARGLVAAQVPYEIPMDGPTTIEVFDGDTPLNTIPLGPSPYQLGLFDTVDRTDGFGLPVLAALNQDGSVNSRSNPARDGSIVSIFGSGLGALSPGLVTGALAPATPLSGTSFVTGCYNCQLLYLGSAPGMSTSIFQANVQVSYPYWGAAEVRPTEIGVVVGLSPRGLFPYRQGIVFVRP